MKQLTPQDQNKIKKAMTFLQNKDVSTFQNLVEIEDKLTVLEGKISAIQDVKSEILNMKEELKKKLESELVLEIDRAELMGEKGDTGEQGIPGENGLDGRHGLNGRDGLDGRDGRDGKDGKDGKNGLNGKDGLDGKDGKGVTMKQVKEELDPFLKDVYARASEKQFHKYDGGFIETGIKAGDNITVNKDSSGSWVINSSASGDDNILLQSEDLSPVLTSSDFQNIAIQA